MSKRWVTPTTGGDAALIAAIDAVDEPLQALECVLEWGGNFGDNYYREINYAVWRMMRRVLEASGIE